MFTRKNSRDTALELVENGMVSAEDMLTMALKYMSNDDVEDMRHDARNGKPHIRTNAA